MKKISCLRLRFLKMMQVIFLKVTYLLCGGIIKKYLPIIRIVTFFIYL